MDKLKRSEKYNPRELDDRHVKKLAIVMARGWDYLHYHGVVAIWTEPSRELTDEIKEHLIESLEDPDSEEPKPELICGQHAHQVCLASYHLLHLTKPIRHVYY